MTRDGFITTARQMYADARNSFYLAVREQRLDKDERMRAKAWSILCAIGEVSPDEGLAAMQREASSSAPAAGEGWQPPTVPQLADAFRAGWNAHCDDGGPKIDDKFRPVSASPRSDTSPAWTEEDRQRALDQPEDLDE